MTYYTNSNLTFLQIQTIHLKYKFKLQFTITNKDFNYNNCLIQKY